MTNQEKSELITRYLFGEASENEKRLLLNWLKSDRLNRKYFMEMKDLWESSELMNPMLKRDEEIDTAWHRLKVRMEYSIDITPKVKVPVMRRIYIYAARAAAVILLVFCLNWVLSEIKQSQRVEAELAYNEVIIPNRQRGQVILSDSTVVWLNSGSSLKYPAQFAENSREVILSGEAFFEVTPNLNSPFYVRTATADVVVHGTSFNVMTYPDQDIMETTLVEGSVSIVNKLAESRKAEAITLKPNQKASLSRINAEVELREVATELYTSWKDGELIFQNETLGQIAFKLEKLYDLQIIFEDPALHEYRLSGKFRDSEPIDQVFKVIKLTTRVDYVIIPKDNQVLIKMKK